MHVRKAVITAAGRGARLYPAATTVQKAMLPLVDRDGATKPLIQVIAEDALAGGIEEICLVCAPGDEAEYLAQFGALRAHLLESYQDVEWARAQAAAVDDLLGRLCFVAQDEPLGYADAVSRARGFTGDAPFLLLLGDHVFLAGEGRPPCAAQLTAIAQREACAVSAVTPTREHLIGRYGTVGGRPVAGHPGLFQVERILEKPSISVAELELQTPGLRVGHYLCFFGMHVLTPGIYPLIDAQIARDGADAQLTPALHELAQCERYLAAELHGSRLDISQTFGLLRAQIALALAGETHDEMLHTLTAALVEAHERGRAEGAAVR